MRRLALRASGVEANVQPSRGPAALYNRSWFEPGLANACQGLLRHRGGYGATGSIPSAPCGLPSPSHDLSAAALAGSDGKLGLPSDSIHASP